MANGFIDSDAADRWQRAHDARAEAVRILSRAAGDWDESLHPRDEDGRFAGGGGGGTGSETTGGSGRQGRVTASAFEKAGVELPDDVKGKPEEVKRYVEQWNDKIGVPPAEFKKQFLGGVPATMMVKFYGANATTVQAAGELLDPEGHKLGVYTSGFTHEKSGMKGKVDYLKLERAAQGKGIAKDILRGNVEFFQSKGITKVELHANIDVGGHAWAKYGFVPRDWDWAGLRHRLNERLGRLTGSSRSSSGGAGSWQEMTADDQSATEGQWKNETFEEFYDSEVDSWREGGQPLNEAKTTLVDAFQRDRSGVPFGVEAISIARAKLENQGITIPYTNEQILAAISLTYADKYDDGTPDPDIEFDDSLLQEPEGAPGPEQETLPGIEPQDLSQRLTQEMRDRIIGEMIDNFNDQAESDAADMDVPDYIRDQAAEYQADVWESKDEDEMFELATRYGIVREDDEGDEDIKGTSTVSDEEVAALKTLIRSDDPKAMWAVADSKYGKDLLLGSDWFGTLDMTDKQTAERFNAYVQQKRAAAA